MEMGGPKSVKSAERALAVLDLLGDHDGRTVSATSIARTLGMPRSSTYHLLNAMRRAHYAEYRGDRRGWMLGERARALGIADPPASVLLSAVEAFDAYGTRLTVSQLAERLRLSMAETARVVETLDREGVLVEEDGELRLGLRLARIARRLPELDGLRARARPALVRLRDETGETANLLVRNGDRALYVDQVESPQPLRHAGWTGRQIPLNGASGAALTGHEGAAVAVGVIEPGVVAVACAIPADGLDAAISVTGPSVRLRGAALQRVITAVERDAAGL
jgi:IclR family transcriptional regulator, acetate operon repressor